MDQDETGWSRFLTPRWLAFLVGLVAVGGLVAVEVGQRHWAPFEVRSAGTVGEWVAGAGAVGALLGLGHQIELEARGRKEDHQATVRIERDAEARRVWIRPKAGDETTAGRNVELYEVGNDGSAPIHNVAIQARYGEPKEGDLWRPGKGLIGVSSEVSESGTKSIVELFGQPSGQTNTVRGILLPGERHSIEVGLYDGGLPVVEAKVAWTDVWTIRRAVSISLAGRTYVLSYRNVDQDGDEGRQPDERPSTA